jgi:hypothetical protein
VTQGPHDALPLLAVKGRKRSALDGGKDALTLGLSVVVGAPSQAVELSPLLAEELLHHLHRKLHEAASARARAHWIGGRFYNWALDADTDYIALSRAHLMQVFALLDMTSPQSLQNRMPFLLRVDAARKAHDVLGAQLNVAQDVLRQGLE